MNFIHCDTYEQASRQAANLISAQVILKPNAVLGLATGSTPLGVYAQLARRCAEGELDFSRAVSFNLDEYMGLAPDHDQSYHYYMQANFFSKVNFRPGSTHVPDGLSADPAAVGQAYDADIEAAGGIDLQLLGIGHNGHIGFNEPDRIFEKATHLVQLKQSTREANARFFAGIDDVPTQAVTMGMMSIMHARRVVLMACGEEKREILERAVHGPVTPEVPASILQLHPDLTVVFSEESAN